MATTNEDENKYEYFRKNIIITGRHAMYCDDLWKQNDVQYQNSFFKRLIDLYTIAPIIGLRTRHRAMPDTTQTENKRTIQLEQIYSRREDLLTIMQTILLLDDTDGLSTEDKINRTFRGPQCQEEYDHNVDIFTSYALGGIEILHDLLIKRGIAISDKYTNVRIANIMALLNDPLESEI